MFGEAILLLMCSVGACSKISCLDDGYISLRRNDGYIALHDIAIPVVSTEPYIA